MMKTASSGENDKRKTKAQLIAELAGIRQRVSQLEAAEEMLRESEEKFRGLFESSSDALMTLEPPAWRFTSGNPAAVEMFRAKSVEEFLACAPGTLSSEQQPDGRASTEKSKEMIEEAMRERSHLFEWTHKRINGEEFPASVLLTRMEFAGKPFLQATVRDITERKQLETEIQDAREYAENIVETVREPLVVLTADLKILTANHSFYETFKVSPEETIGHFIYDLGNRQWDIPRLRVLLEEILPQDTVFNGYEVEHDFLNIGRKVILLNARQIFRATIGSHIVLLAMEDITERKRAEEALHESESRFRAAAEGSLDAFYIFKSVRDEKGQIIDFEFVDLNAHGEKLIGMPRQEIISQRLCELIPINRTDGFFDKYVRVVETGETLDEEFPINAEQIHAV